jgi:hypothetical protein
MMKPASLVIALAVANAASSAHGAENKYINFVSGSEIAGAKTIRHFFPDGPGNWKSDGTLEWIARPVGFERAHPTTEGLNSFHHKL